MTSEGLTSEPTTSRRLRPVVVRAASYGDPDVLALVAEVQAHYVEIYGGEDETPMTPDDFAAPEGTFVVATIDGDPVGCGAFRRHDGTDVAEIKRMYVRPGERGRGVGRAVLEDLERRAGAAGYARVVLETGARQPEALALYASAGYRDIEPYGFYRCSPLSRCFGKSSADDETRPLLRTHAGVTDLELVGSPAVPDGAVVTDRALLDRAVDGDARAFGELFARHSAAVHTYCFRRLGTWSAAEDATSVVFLEVWRRRDSVPENLAPEAGGSLLPWIYGVANNVVRNHARSVRRHRAALERLPQSLREPDPADGVAERLDAERRMHDVLEHLRGLTRVEQEVVALCVWSELSYDQAAVALGVPVATVRSRLARARAHLREATQTHRPEGEPS